MLEVDPSTDVPRSNLLTVQLLAKLGRQPCNTKNTTHDRKRDHASSEFCITLLFSRTPRTLVPVRAGQEGFGSLFDDLPDGVLHAANSILDPAGGLLRLAVGL